MTSPRTLRAKMVLPAPKKVIFNMVLPPKSIFDLIIAQCKEKTIAKWRLYLVKWNMLKEVHNSEG